MRIFSYIILSFLFITVASAQVENEVGFKYMKAKYLVETERYEDAIKAFDEIIGENSNYEDALVLRALSKYKMAAYRGTKMDIIEYIKENGVSADAALWLGKADYKMGNFSAALNSLSLATAHSADADAYEYMGDIYNNDGKQGMACEYYNKSSRMGSSKAAAKYRNICGSVSSTPRQQPETRRDDDIVILNPENKLPKSTDVEISTEPSSSTSDPIFKEKPKKDSEVVVVKSEPTTSSNDTYDRFPPEDNTPQTVEIDEDLSISIYGQGLGSRRVLDQPNILILSDVDGIVAVDICVNKRGKVESAELNDSKSTMKKEHLVSLALRKAKEFWFEKNSYEEQCGTMLFDIKKM